jgi:hypothetical protein
MPRLALGVSVSVSVALLLPGTGSAAAELIAAVLLSEPVAPAAMLQLAMNVAVPLTGRFTLLLMLPEPDAGQLAPPAPAQVQLQLSVPGNVSVTVAPLTVFGPALLATIVYVTGNPGVPTVTPSVIVMPRLELKTSVSVSVALLLDGTGSATVDVTEAVLLTDPVALAAIVQLAVNVVLPPAGRLTLLLMLPDPDAGQVAPPAPAQVQLQLRAAGSVSVTIAPLAALGPALLATMV